jgi:TonB family protein
MSADKHDSELQRYLNGEMSQQERHAFERKALDDPFMQEAIEGAELITPQEFSNDVASLQERLTSSRSTFVWWRVAAVALLFILGGWSVWMLVDNPVEKQLTENKDSKEEEVAPTSDAVAEAEMEVEEPVVVEIEEKVAKPVARVEPPKERPTEREGAGAKVASKPVAAQSAPSPVVAEVSDVEMDMDEISEMEVEDVSSDNVDKALRGKVSGVATRSQAKKQTTADHNKSWFQTRKMPSERTVSGQVTDDFGDPFPGVNVIIKGSTTGVTTDLDGQYQIAVSDPATALVFSSVGMRSEEVAVGERSEIDVDLESDSQALQEVVVTGYGAFDNNPEGYVEAMPTMGHSEFKKYLEEELFYPEEAISQGIEGRVVLQLVISRTGNVADIEVKRGLGYGCDEEAIRLIKEGPRWSPATRDGINVESKVRVRIKFELK